MPRKKVKRLRTGNADQRRSKVIAASRSHNPIYLPQVLERLQREPEQANRRHLVRALGNIGGELAEVTLLRMLTEETGLILGDIATSLGKLGCRRAIAPLKRLASHQIPWVAQQASYALKHLQAHR